MVGDDPREDVLRVAGLPVGAVVGLGAAGQDVLGLRGVIRGQAVGVVGLDAAEVRQHRRVARRVGDRVGRVQAGGQPEVGLGELEVEQAAHERRVAVDVVGADHREDRLERRVAADRAGKQQLVDPEVRRPVGADAPVGMRQVSRPVQDLDRVALLDRIEQAPAAVRVAGAADVLDDLDVAALDQVVVRAAGRARAARRGRRARAARPALALAVRRHRQQHGERSLGRRAGRRRRIDLVDPDRGTAGAVDRDVVRRRSPVDGLLGRPVASRRGAGGDDARRQLGIEPDEARRRRLDRGRTRRGRRRDR